MNAFVNYKRTFKETGIKKFNSKKHEKNINTAKINRNSYFIAQWLIQHLLNKKD
jgi:hypothetical protein